MSKVRLDALLARRGLFGTRTRAAASVMAGEVRVGRHGQPAVKPGQLVADDIDLVVARRPDYVSRGGRKLANALEATTLPVAGRRALDVGASTGGFTDCLLQHGAVHVTAVDVAYGELSWRLREDERVSVLERINARYLRPDELSDKPDLIVVDVSFISLTKVLPAVLGCAAERFDCLALCKPQFEVGRGRVGKGGVVREPGDRRAAMVSVARAGQASGASVQGFAPSGLPGPKGNLETFVWLADPARPGVKDLAAAAREVEP